MSVEREMITLQRTCRICKKEFEIKVWNTDFFKYRQGALIQDAFPYLTPSQRELLISGLCADCWNDMFPPEEYEDEVM